MKTKPRRNTLILWGASPDARLNRRWIPILWLDARAFDARDVIQAEPSEPLTKLAARKWARKAALEYARTIVDQLLITGQGLELIGCNLYELGQVVAIRPDPLASGERVGVHARQLAKITDTLKARPGGEIIELREAPTIAVRDRL